MLIARAVSGFSTRIKLYINSCKFLKNVPLRGPLTNALCRRQLLFYVCAGNVVYCRGGSLGWRENLYGK
jgi:hypothetical protein